MVVYPIEGGPMAKGGGTNLHKCSRDTGKPLVSLRVPPVNFKALSSEGLSGACP